MSAHVASVRPDATRQRTYSWEDQEAIRLAGLTQDGLTVLQAIGAGQDSGSPDRRDSLTDKVELPHVTTRLCQNAPMLVHGAITPPRAVVEALDAVVRSVPQPLPEVEEPVARGILRRFGRHRADADEPPEAPPGMLEHVPVERMTMPITGFGNLTTTDVNRVADVIRSAAADWAAPRVRFAGGTALDFPGDWSVWAKLGGDVEATLSVARGVTQAVETLGFFVDRRQFRPMLSVATVTPATTGPYLEELVAALEAFVGEEWTVDISLTKETFVGGRPATTEFARISLDG